MAENKLVSTGQSATNLAQDNTHPVATVTYLASGDNSDFMPFIRCQSGRFLEKHIVPGRSSVVLPFKNTITGSVFACPKSGRRVFHNMTTASALAQELLNAVHRALIRAIPGVLFHERSLPI
jgi:hypothetical protein